MAAPAAAQEGPRGPLIAGVVTGVVILLAALAVGLYFGLRGDGKDDPSDTSTVRPTSTASTSTTEAAFKQEEGEILLEAVGTAGPNSFTGETFVPAGPPPSLNISPPPPSRRRPHCLLGPLRRLPLW